jgi:VWFA-related protein
MPGSRKHRNAIMTTSSSCRVLMALAAGVALVVGGQASVTAQRPAFKSGVDIVPLTVTVTDAAGRHVPGLTDQDFTVLEDGVEQPVSFFASGDVPLDVALAIDTSSSMRSELPLVQAAAIGLVGKLRPSDRGAIVEIKGTAGIPQPFTSDRALIERSIRALKTSGDTALYDAIYVVLKEFERERRESLDIRRQALVLLSDGLDNKSHLAFEDVMEAARRGGVNIYTISLRGQAALLPRADLDGRTLQAEYTMGAVARESGGRPFFPRPSASFRPSTRRSRRSWPTSTSWDMCRRGPAATAPSGVSQYASPPARMRSRGREAATTPRARGPDYDDLVACCPKVGRHAHPVAARALAAGIRRVAGRDLCGRRVRSSRCV